MNLLIFERIRDILQIGLERNEVTFTIAATATLSDAADCINGSLVAVLLPAAMSATNIFIQGSHDNVTFQRITDHGGVDVAITFVADRWATVDPTLLLPYRYIKLESDTAEVAQRILPGITRHLS